MQLTLDVPDDLAARLKSERGSIAEILESGLRVRQWVGASKLADEVINFLSRGPEPHEMLQYHPSQAAADRARELLEKNRESHLTPREQAELDEMALLDHLMTLIKARAWERSKNQ